MQFDGERTTALYNYKQDWMMTHNLKGALQPVERRLERRVKAIIQSYMERMNGNELILKIKQNSTL